MAGHRAVLGVLQALKERLDVRMPPLTGGSPKAVILGWTPFVQKAIRQQARRNFEHWQARRHS